MESLGDQGIPGGTGVSPVIVKSPLTKSSLFVYYSHFDCSNSRTKFPAGARETAPEAGAVPKGNFQSA